MGVVVTNRYVLLLIVLAATLAGSSYGADATNGESANASVEQLHERDGVRVALSVDRARLRWSDYLSLLLEVRSPEQDRVSMPHVGDVLGDFRIVARQPVDPPRNTPGPRTWVRKYTLEPVSAGALTIPALGVDVTERSTIMTRACRQSRDCIRQRNRSKTAYTISTDPIPVTVTTMLGDVADIHAPMDIAQPLALASTELAIGARHALTLLVLTALVIGTLAWRRRRGETGAPAPAPAAPAQAFDPNAALEALASDALAPVDDLYERLSNIIRNFIAERYGFTTHAATTQQLVSQLAAANADQRRRTTTLLGACDQVKFAAARPARDRFLEHIEHTRRLLRDASA